MVLTKTEKDIVDGLTCLLEKIAKNYNLTKEDLRTLYGSGIFFLMAIDGVKEKS